MYGTYRQQSSMDEGAALGILQHLGAEDLQKLLDDESKLNDIIMDLPQVKNLLAEKENCMLTNKSLAEYNMSREPKLLQGKQQLAEVYERGVEVQKDYEQKKQRFDCHAAQQNLDTMLALLQTETAKAEEESETLADQFLEGNIEVEEFRKQYIDKRILAHLRKVKCEKMQEILRNQSRTGSFAPSFGMGGNGPIPSRHAPPPPLNQWNNSGAPSYPMGQPDGSSFQY